MTIIIIFNKINIIIVEKLIIKNYIKYLINSI